MARTVCVLVGTTDRRRLEAITLDRNRQRKEMERARVIVASVGGGSVQRIAPEVGVSRPMLWRWQQRFAEEGVHGLLHDKTGKPGKPPIAAETVARVVALPGAAPSHEATHWCQPPSEFRPGWRRKSMPLVTAWGQDGVRKEFAPTFNWADSILSY